LSEIIVSVMQINVRRLRILGLIRGPFSTIGGILNDQLCTNSFNWICSC